MAKKRILIIDDEKGFTDLVKTILEETGRYEVREVNKGREGYPVAVRYNPDLILLDLMMPTMDGSSVAEQLGNDPATKDAPVIFITAAVTAEETQGQHGIIGGRTFMAKPIKTRELIACVDNALGI